MTDGSLRRKTLVGTFFAVGARGLIRLLDLLTLVILARLLTPADFGLVAIAASLILIAEAVFELPLASVLSREVDLRREHLDTSFTLTLLKGLALALVGGMLAVGTVVGYHDPRLGAVTLCLAAGPALRGLQSPALIFLFRDMRFGRTSIIDVGGKVVGLVSALLIAFLFHSYWALVANVLLTQAATLVTSYCVAPYRPKLSLAEWPAFSSAIKWNSASQLVAAANWQSDRVILASFVPEAQIGRYALASTMAAFPEQAIVKPIGGPVLAALAKVSADPLRLASVYLKASRSLVAIGAPLFILLSVLGPRACILILGGQKWAAAGPILVWLALPPLLALPYSALPSLAFVTGNSKLYATRSLYEFAVQIPLSLVLIYYFGIPGALIARFVTATYMLVISFMLVKRVGNIAIRAQLACFRDSTVALIPMWLTLHYVGELLSASQGIDELLKVGIIASLGLLVYSLAHILSWSMFGRSDGLETHFFASVERAKSGSFVQFLGRSRSRET